MTYKEALMRAIRLDEDVHPLSEFRASVASFVRQVTETGRPLLLTQNGRGVAVLIDVRGFEAMRARLELLEEIDQAERQVAAGRVTPREAAKSRVLGGLGA
jgi:antitoxin YefM